MNDLESLKKILLKGIGRRQIDIIVQAVEHKPYLFNELMHLYLSNEEPVSRQAAWVVDIITEKQKELIIPWTEDMTLMLREFRHDALKRHTLRILCSSQLPEENLGILVSKCFDWLVSTSEAIAVKVYAMEILYRVSEVEHDLKKELAETITWRLNEESAGFRNRGLKILKKLSL